MLLALKKRKLDFSEWEPLMIILGPMALLIVTGVLFLLILKWLGG